MLILTYAIALILLSGWLVGFFGFNTGKEVHMLLVLSLVTLSSAIIIKEEPKLHKKSLKT
jgi:hypothetical protein